jgi:hypothetical protein
MSSSLSFQSSRAGLNHFILSQLHQESSGNKKAREMAKRKRVLVVSVLCLLRV